MIKRSKYYYQQNGKGCIFPYLQNLLQTLSKHTETGKNMQFKCQCFDIFLRSRYNVLVGVYTTHKKSTQL